MATSTKIDVDTKRLRIFFAQMIRRSNNFAPVFTKALRDIENEEARHFASRGGGTWPPLAASTRAQKRREGFQADLLQRTGALRDSLVSGGPGGVRNLTPKTMEFGTSVEYAGYHFNGAQKGNWRLPVRNPLVRAETFANSVAQDAGGWIVYGREWQTKRAASAVRNLSDIL
ncbi:MAG: hypothetical protein VW907_00505 [Opitutae bacterium]